MFSQETWSKDIFLATMPQDTLQYWVKSGYIFGFYAFDTEFSRFFVP